MKKDTSYIGECVALLRLMKGDRWIDSDPDRGEMGHDFYYGQVFAEWPADLSRRVARRCADTLTWRPSRADLYSIAAELESPLPTSEDVIIEILEMRSNRGYLGRIIGELPSGNPDFVAGEPNDWSHPLIGRVVRALGGWIAVCKEHDKIGVLKAQITELWEGCCVEWKIEVRRYLHLSPDERQADPEIARYFPQWKRRKVIPAWKSGIGAQKTLAAARPEQGLVAFSDLPAEMQIRIRKAIKGMPAASESKEDTSSGRPTTMTPQKHREIEAELVEQKARAAARRVDIQA